MVRDHVFMRVQGNNCYGNNGNYSMCSWFGSCVALELPPIAEVKGVHLF